MGKQSRRRHHMPVHVHLPSSAHPSVQDDWEWQKYDANQWYVVVIDGIPIVAEKRLDPRWGHEGRYYWHRVLPEEDKDCTDAPGVYYDDLIGYFVVQLQLGDDHQFQQRFRSKKKARERVRELVDVVTVPN